jgi:hypothetical protein
VSEYGPSKDPLALRAFEGIVQTVAIIVALVLMMAFFVYGKLTAVFGE